MIFYHPSQHCKHPLLYSEIVEQYLVSEYVQCNVKLCHSYVDFIVLNI